MAPPRLKIYLLFAHPSFEKSRVQTHLLQAAQALPDVTVRDLYEEYPDFDIDVAREQKALLEHDIIVMQHPFYWYAAPPIVKQWIDLVLEHGFAYGREGKSLHGKWYMHATTTGAPGKAYHSDGHNRFTMRELLAPFDQTAFLCGMIYLAPFVVHASHLIDSPQDMTEPSRRYQQVLARLQTGDVDLEQACGADSIDVILRGR